MKKGLRIFLVAMSTILAVGCGQKNNSSSDGESSSSQEVTKYHITFDLNGGSGQAPAMQDKEEGAKFKLPSTDSTKEGFDFGGWNEGENLYAVGIEFTMPARDVNFIAKWNEHIDEHVAHPHFSQESYTYDKLAGEDLELPLDLDGASFYYLEIDENTVPYAQVSYNDSKKCVVVAEEFVLDLEIGEHNVKAVTDGDEEPATCKLIITNSVTTSFDEVTTKDFKLGYQEDVRFSITLNGTTVKRLTCRNGELLVDPAYYSVQDGQLIVSGDWLRYFYLGIDFEVVLSNNDKYQFTINTNSIFYTDYDVTTIHNTTESNLGLNPLYQYYDNVSIENAPEGMSGKALKFVPNTVDVTYDCHCIYTIRTSIFESTWYEAPFDTSKNYIFSFDYMTHNTTTGQFRFQEQDNTWGEDLLLGAANDDVVHHYSRFVRGGELNKGAKVYAFFKGAQGYIWFDNFRICEVENAPVIDAGENYTYTNAAKEIAADLKGLIFKSVSLDGNVLASTDYEYNREQNKVVLSASLMESLEQGLHTVSINTPICPFSASFRCIKPIVCIFDTTTFDYDPLSQDKAVFTGTFDSRLEISGLYQVDKVDQSDCAAYSGWDFCVNDTVKNYKNCATITSNSISISKDLLDVLYGTTNLRFEFNNGSSQEVTINSTVKMFSNFDDTTMLGYFNGEFRPGSPLYSGMWGNGTAINVKEYETGNKGLSVTSTENSEGKNLFNVKLHDHVWEWYQANGRTDSLYRVTFKYRLTNINQNSVYFYVMSLAENAEALRNCFYGNYDAAVPVYDYYEVRYNLIADGQFHTFDSGYFNIDPTLRMMKIQLPNFAASENREVLIDDYKLLGTKVDNAEGSYTKGSGTAARYTLPSGNVAPQSIKINNQNIRFNYTEGESEVTLNSEDLETLPIGKFKFVADHGDSLKVFKDFSITDNRVATLTETNKQVTYKGGSVKLAGEFTPGLGITSFKRLGSENWDNTNGKFNYQTSSDGTMDKTKLTVEADGLVVGQEIVDQVYGSMHYTVVFENGKTIEFDLVSNTVYYSNWNETHVCREGDPGQNAEFCQDYTMATWVMVDGRRVLRYTPSAAVLGHALGDDNRICTFSVNNDTNWWQWNLGSVTSANKLYIEVHYQITGDFDTFKFDWRDNAAQWHSVEMPKAETHFYLELDPTNVKMFGIGCSTHGSASAGAYMDIYDFCFGIK